MKKHVAIIIGFLMVIALPSSSFALLGFGADVAIGMAQNTTTGTFGYGSTAMDFEDNFGFDEATQAVMMRAKINHPIPIIPEASITIAPMSFTGTGTFGSITFGGETFASTTDSTLTLNQTDYAVYWSVPLLPTLSAGIFNVDFGLNLRMLDLSLEVIDTSGGVPTQTAEADVPIPMGYLAVQIDPPIIPLILEAEMRILSLSSDVSYSSQILRVKFNLPIPIPIGDIYIAAGYRADTIIIDDDNIADDLNIDINFSTLFVEAGYNF